MTVTYIWYMKSNTTVVLNQTMQYLHIHNTHTRTVFGLVVPEEIRQSYLLEIHIRPSRLTKNIDRTAEHGLNAY